MGKATRSNVRASRHQWGPSTTPPPLPHRRHRNYCSCGECCLRLELSTPGEVSFPAKAALAVGRVVRGLRGEAGAGLRYRYRNRRRGTVCAGTRYRRPAVKYGSYLGGGAGLTAEGERRRRGRLRRRWGRGLSYDISPCGPDCASLITTRHA